jgi:hypothetical protein
LEKSAFLDSFRRVFRQKNTQSKKNPAAEKFTIDRNQKRTLQRAMKHNQQEGTQNRSFVIDYKKLNGDVVKRKIDPLEIKNNVVIAYDHHRDDLRSFKVERINTMTKAAFWGGFSKQARCWKGYKPVRGKKPYSKGSCEKKDSK